MPRILAFCVVAFACTARGEEPSDWLRKIESLSVRPTPMTDWWSPPHIGFGFDARSVPTELAVVERQTLDPNIIPVELRD
jgi:hypothetical protein